LLTTVKIRKAIEDAENITKKRKITWDKGVKKGYKASEVSYKESESDLEEQIDTELEILDMIEVEF